MSHQGVLPADRLWTVRDVELFAGITRSTIWRLRRAGKLSSVRVGGVVRFSPLTVRRELGQPDSAA